jgi:hypothetical protein
VDTYVSRNAYVSTNALHAYVSTNALHAYVSTNALHAYVSTNALLAYVSINALRAYVSTNALHACASTNALHVWLLQGAVTAVAVRPDGVVVASGGVDGLAKISNTVWTPLCATRFS